MPVFAETLPNMGISFGHTAWTLPAVSAQSAAEGKLPANERMLQAALRRAVSAKAGVTMLVLHAADLPGAASRPHRAKLARAVLDDVAEQVDGEVFRLTNGDLVLMARRPGSKLGLGGLASTLGRLFDHPPEDCVRYVSCWPLDQSAAEATTYVASRLAEGAEQPPRLASQPLASMDWPGTVLSGGPIWDLLSRQTAVRLPDIADRRPGALIPLHHALSFSVGMLQARAPVPAADLDRCMARHLATGLEPALLAQLAAHLGRHGWEQQPTVGRAASLAGLSRGAPVFLALGLRALAAPEFVALLQAGHGEARPRGWLGVEIPWLETVSDTGLFARVRAILTEQQVPWALSGLSHGSLLMGTPQRLRADLIKLDWSSSLAGDSAERLKETNAALDAIGPARIILAGADSEAAVRWGVTRGIRRFQGPHVEAMLAASRMLVCPQARGCTLSQCSQRGTAIAGAGRAGCLRPNLLDGDLIDGADPIGMPP